MQATIKKLIFPAVICFMLIFLLPAPAEAEQLFRKRTTPVEVWDTIRADYPAQGIEFDIIFTKGRAHNHPLMVLWLEDFDGNYIQTLYIAESIGKGVFRHGDPSTGRWMPGPVRRPAALPYWGHQRGVQAEDGYYLPTQDDPMPDGITGPTPKASFIVHAQTPDTDLRQFRVLFEINQSWDWNEYWTNNKYPGDEQYMSSSQPALVYEAVVDLDSGIREFELVPVGHSHWSGQNGKIYKDLSTITTALDITKSIKLRIAER